MRGFGITYFDSSFPFVPEQRRGDEIGLYIVENIERYLNEFAGGILYVFKRPGRDIEEVVSFDPSVVRNRIATDYGTGTLYTAVRIPLNLNFDFLKQSFFSDSCSCDFEGEFFDGK